VFPRYQSVPPSTSAPEVISCPRTAALESDLSILPLPPTPSTPRLYNFIFSSSIFISRRVSFSIEFDLHYIRFSYRPIPPLTPHPKKRPRTGRVDRLQTSAYQLESLVLALFNDAISTTYINIYILVQLYFL
jgi:hypothetical protein